MPQPPSHPDHRPGCRDRLGRVRASWNPSAAAQGSGQAWSPAHAAGDKQCTARGDNAPSLVRGSTLRQRGEIAVDEAGVEFSGAELRRAAERREESRIAARARRRWCRSSASASRSSASSRVGAVRDHLGDHRIVERRHLAAGLDAGVDADALAVRQFEREELAGRRQEAALGILGIEPRLDRVAVEAARRPARAAASRRRRRGTAIRPDRGR